MSARVRSAGSLVAVFAGVSGVTAANRAGLVGLAALASSPRTAGEGKVWLLVTSAFVADTPTSASLLAFVGFAAAALVVCGPRLTWGIGLAGHFGATAAVYAAIAVTRAIVPTAFENVLSLSDYGTSAMIAAWLGALVAVGWTRYPRLAPRLGVIALTLLSGGVGWLCRPDLTPLDSEHIVAYAIGVAAVTGATWQYPRRVVSEWLAMARGLSRRAFALVGRLGLALRQQQV